MKKRMIAFFLIAVLAAGNLSACGRTATPEEKAEAKAEAEAAISEAKSEVEAAMEEVKTDMEAAAEEVKADAEAAAEEVKTEAEATAEELKEDAEAAAEEAKTEAEAAAEELSVPKDAKPLEMSSLFSENFLLGGLKPVEETPEPEEMTAEQQEQMDRAMRDYKRSADTLLKNKAKTFYYYSQMNKDEQAMYDAMMMVCEDPANPDNITKAIVSADPNSYEFSDEFCVAYYGMLYDHAELFWLYNFIEADMCLYVPYENNAPAGKYEVYFCLDQTYDNYETEMKKFNKAVKKFLEEIDTAQSEDEIVKQIHNKLVNKVTYNTPVAEDGSYWGYCNFAHTAYGALVADSDGNKNYAVCDGYSQAFVYLLQQCGLEAAVIIGVAGPSSYSAGGHAWSVVKLGGKWYEVDSTWDDPGSIEELIEEVRASDEYTYSYLREAFDDKAYKKKLRYYLYNVTTDRISWFEPDDYYYYYTKDGLYSFCLLNSSVHIRASGDTWGYEDYSLLMELAPIATGTKYSMRK